ncbi:hypothetical protein KJS94_18130 [Flavihumibacter rivuli]|uniref:hypothetical protein n=1 Tax=Flavihumibacter rivuli TaxID=2838156 RepID=UPI001BDDF999|nr:hypothetical protein [Flavihumibacter rivuli]ULQ56574.1 hypothetical protein KJS94_18130 [Flavihumibacter rivuli]
MPAFILMLLLAANLAPAQGILNKVKNKVNQAINKPSGSTDNKSSSGNNQGNSSPNSPESNQDKLPGGNALTEKSLGQLQAGEYIISDESQLIIGSNGVNDYLIVTRTKEGFFILSSSGRQGPFKSLSKEQLGSKKSTGMALSEYREGTTTNLKDMMAYTPDYKMVLKYNGKVLTTLDQGVTPMAAAYDPNRDFLTYITMGQKGDRNNLITVHQPKTKKNIELPNAMMAEVLQNRSSGRFLYKINSFDLKTEYCNEDGENTGPYSQNSRVFELANGKDYVVADRGDNDNTTKIYKAGKVIHELDLEDRTQLVLNADGSQYCTVSYRGLQFSDGSQVRTGILPTVERTANGNKLHFLRINENKEIIQCTMPW